MKIYCKECLKKNKDSDETCPHCGNEMVNTLNGEEEIRPFVQRLHKKTNDLRHYISHSLSAVVIGAILLIIAFFFYYLSFKTSVDQSTGMKVSTVNTSCSEFWVSMVAMIVGGISFIAGTVISLVIYRQKRQVLADIDSIRETGSLETKPVKLIVVVWFNKIVASIKHLIWVSKYKKSHKKEKESE